MPAAAVSVHRVFETGERFALGAAPQHVQVYSVAHRRAVEVDQLVVKFDTFAAPVANDAGIPCRGHLRGVREQVDDLAAHGGKHLGCPFFEEVAKRLTL